MSAWVLKEIREDPELQLKVKGRIAQKEAILHLNEHGKLISPNVGYAPKVPMLGPDVYEMIFRDPIKEDTWRDHVNHPTCTIHDSNRLKLRLKNPVQLGPRYTYGINRMLQPCTMNIRMYGKEYTIQFVPETDITIETLNTRKAVFTYGWQSYDENKYMAPNIQGNPFIYLEATNEFKDNFDNFQWLMLSRYMNKFDSDETMHHLEYIEALKARILPDAQWELDADGKYSIDDMDILTQNNQSAIRLNDLKVRVEGANIPTYFLELAMDYIAHFLP